MPTYTAYVTYTVCDEMTIEADNDWDAYAKAEEQFNNEPTFLPLHQFNNSTYGWDGVEISLDTDPDPVLNY